jgi:hypothetical protein
VVQLDQIAGVDMTVPATARDDDESSSLERHELVPSGVEQFDGDRTLESEEQLIGVGVHLPRPRSCSACTKHGEVTVVERDELMKGKFGVTAGDVDWVMSIRHHIIVDHRLPPNGRCGTIGGT